MTRIALVLVLLTGCGVGGSTATVTSVETREVQSDTCRGAAEALRRALIQETLAARGYVDLIQPAFEAGRSGHPVRELRRALGNGEPTRRSATAKAILDRAQPFLEGCLGIPGAGA